MKRVVGQILPFFSLLLFFCPGAFTYGHTVMLLVVTVTPSWMPYASIDGWPQSVTVKESEQLK